MSDTTRELDNSTQPSKSLNVLMLLRSVVHVEAVARLDCVRPD